MRASHCLPLLSAALLVAAACSDSGSTGTEDHPTPSLTGLSPSSVQVGSPGITLTVEGSGFIEESAVLWGGAARTTAFVSASRLQVALTATDLDEAGEIAVTVRTPAPGGGTSGPRTFTVEPPAVATIEVMPTASTLVPGETATLTAVLRSADGAELTDRTPTWSSSDPSVASVDDDGVVTGVATGTATVSLSADGVSAQSDVDVVAGGMALPGGSTVTTAAVVLTVPAGAVSQALALTVTPDGTPPGTATVVPGTAFVLGPDGTTFDQPVAVDIAYDPTDVPTGTAARDLFVARWDGSAWQPLADAEVDSVAHRVSGTTTGFSSFAVLASPPEWRRVAGHPGEGWSAHWGDWTVAAGRLWVVENDAGSQTELPRIHWTSDGETWQSPDPAIFDFPDLRVGGDSWGGNNLMATGTDDEVVIATSFSHPTTGAGSVPPGEVWVVRGTPGNWTVQNPANAPGLDENQIPDDGQYRFSVSALTGARASWGDQVVFLPRSIWWYPFATTDQSFLSLTSDATDLWEMFARREYPWGVPGFQWMTGATGTPWGFFAVGHIGFDTEVWYSADGRQWDVVTDPVDAFGGSRERVAQVWSGTTLYGPEGLLMARVRDTPSEQVVAWRTQDGQTWTEAVVDEETFADIRGFMVGDRYVLTAYRTTGQSSNLRPVWVSSDGESWVRLPQGPDFDQIIGWNDRLWGFRFGEVWEFDLSRLGN